MFHRIVLAVAVFASVATSSSDLPEPAPATGWTQSTHYSVQTSLNDGGYWMWDLEFGVDADVFDAAAPDLDDPLDPLDEAVAVITLRLDRPAGYTGSGAFSMDLYNDLIFAEGAGLSYGEHTFMADDVLKNDIYIGCVMDRDEETCANALALDVQSTTGPVEVTVDIDFRVSGPALPNGAQANPYLFAH